ncbi:MAG: hypothetical protein EHM12_10205 [Dehalococcoidia bacterium]|nr:MAG: hypothetical protein EHM12_10205 [Dehalococcoidia bacterium]
MLNPRQNNVERFLFENYLEYTGATRILLLLEDLLVVVDSIKKTQEKHKGLNKQKYAAIANGYELMIDVIKKALFEVIGTSKLTFNKEE